MFINISLDLDLQNPEKQIRMYDVPTASSKPYRSGEWVGSTELGGSCNFQTLHITPHCNGTHTECIGHIVNDKIFLPDILVNPVFFSLLITIPFHTLENNDDFGVNENYLPRLEKGDKLLIKKDIEEALSLYSDQTENSKVEGLIIRTKPNDLIKKKNDYNLNPAPFFSNDAIALITDLGFKHLIVDIPSLDKAFDEGYLSNHHIFWNQKLKNYSLENSAFLDKTITELVFIPEEVQDGFYETFIGFPNWKEEAIPSSVWIKK